MISYRKQLKNALITVLILAASFFASLLLQDVLDVREHITTMFVFAVFIISLTTDGYIWGLLATLFGVLAVNFAFTFPYFSFNFSIRENFLSGVVMLVIALMTSTLTTRLKTWEMIKAEGEREKMRANLLRAVSHDLRTPLTTIYGSSSAILENYSTLTDEQKVNMINGIKQDSEWLVRMVENLLSVTKLEGASLKLIKTPIVLEELIDSVCIKFRKRYPKEKVELTLPDEMILIPMDAILIEQVLVNILENAVQHAKGMTKISLKVFMEGNKAIFEISDDGEGIDKKSLQNIFSGSINPSENAADSKKRNAGIGLSVCQSIIKAHGGEISAENAAAGGAVFKFALEAEVSDEQ